MLRRQTIKLKYATINRCRLMGGLTYHERVPAALAVDATTGTTVKRMTTLNRMGKWLAAQGFEWNFGSNGQWSRTIIDRGV